MSSPAHSVICGSFVGTGTALTIKTLNSKVKSLELLNITSGDSARYASSMPDGAMAKRLAAGTASFIAATTGVTPYSAADGAGFTLGADADMNVAGEVVHYIAICE